MAAIEAIATIYLEADASSVTFSSIPQTYEHLQLRYTLALNTTNNSYQRLYLGDGSADEGANYSQHMMYGHDAAAPVAWSGTSSSIGVYAGQSPGSSDRSWAGRSIIDILDYVNTNKNTTVLVFNNDGGTASYADYIQFGSALWDDTAAVDTILINDRNGHNFLRGAEFTLYGWNSS
jgi:hypothetical protein